MSNETDSDLVGFGATLGLAENERIAADRSVPLRARLVAAVGPGRDADAGPRTPPRQRTLAAVAVWAFVLGLGGFVVGASALVRMIAGTPSWFQPTIVVIGVLGIALTVGGFATVQRRFVPWAMLGLATACLVAGAISTASA
ncbi:hypothetical protein [Longispora albida]|uniref:hypothetical protein n=1 Tax=Longispora albida TaxID=203523 RepID=UPI0003697DA9|nr:hypothetical protein [Longispora albida]